MVDFKCRKYAKHVEKQIELFNQGPSLYKLRLSDTSDDLDSLPYQKGKEKSKKYLDLIDANLGEYYTEYNSIINDIDANTLMNDMDGKFRWQEHKYLEMISSVGLFYVEILDNNDITLGFFSFCFTNDSLIQNDNKPMRSFFDQPKKQNIFYLMEIQLNKNASNKGLGKLIFDNFIFELCKDQKLAMEFVCFKKNQIGNSFYTKMGISTNTKATVISTEMNDIINIYRMESPP